MGPPHDPYIAPDEYMAQYDPEGITLRPNFAGDTSDRELEPSPYVETPGRKEIAAYYAMVTAVDDQVGRILVELDELGLRENTIVIVSSDHGDMLGSHGTRLKRKPWEESIRVPGIVRHPGAPAGRETDALFSHVDIAPTLLSLCGLPVPPEMQGASLAPAVLGQAESGPSAAYFQIFGPFLAGGVERGWRGLRTDRFMYARTKDAPWVLYDLEADPYELKNLVAVPEAGPTLAELDAELTRWMERTGDSWDFDWTAPIEDAGRLYKHEAFYTVEDFFQWAAENPELAQLP